MKKMKNYTVITVITIAFLSATTLVAQDWSKEQKEVWQVVENSWAKWQEGDIDASVEGIHEKYLGWNIEMPLPTTKEKWVKDIKQWKDNVTMDYYDIVPARIVVYKDVAVIHYYYEQSMTYTKDDEKKTYKFDGKNTEFYIKEDGKWFLIGDMTVWKDKK